MTVDPIDVASCIDEFYADHLVVTMCSAAASSTRPIRFHLLAIGMPPTVRAFIERSAAAFGVHLIVVDLDPAQFAGLPTWAHTTAATFARLLLPSSLVDLERVLYVDADVVVVDDLAEFPDVLTPGTVVGAVVNPSRSTRRGATRPTSTDEANFNAGVMLMDLEEFRATGIAEEALRLCRLDGTTYRHDQDALNATCRGRWTRLPMRWNLQHSMYPSHRFDRADDEVREARRSPGIIHFSSSVKPWHHHSRHPERHRYHEWRRIAGLPDVDLRPTNARQMAKRWAKIVIGRT